MVDALSVEPTREQRAAIESAAHVCAIHAGAGSGKTFTLARRVERLARVHGAQRLVVVTFTREATASLHRKLALLLGRDHLVRVGSFHQWAARELPPDERRFIDEAEARRLLAQLLASRPRLARAMGGEGAARAAALISLAKNRECGVEAALQSQSPRLSEHGDELTALAETYEERKGSRLDYDDLLLAFRDKLKSRAFRDDVASRVAHVFVDEYQDVSAPQHDVVRRLASTPHGPGATVVGDARQAIYGFRGGSPQHLLRFHEPFGRLAEVHHLTRNFRASTRLVAAANAVEPGSRPMRAATRRLGERVQVVGAPDPQREAACAADRVEALLGRGVDPLEIAVLCRARHLAEAYAREAASRARTGSPIRNVHVRTIHAAKGLEFDHLVLVGAREGGLPGEHALAASEPARAELLAEEKRLMYVAVTRARESFVATWCGRGPSRFLVGATEPARAKRHGGRVRSALAKPA